MKSAFKSYFYIIFLSAFIVFAAVSCGDNVSDGGGDEKVSVRLKMDGLFEDEARSKRTSIGGHPVTSLFLDVSAAGWSGLRLNLTDMLNRNENEIDVEITAGKIYTFAVSAYTSGNVLLCSGSESAMIRANSEVGINLVCALQISVDLSAAKMEGVMNFLDYQSNPLVQHVMQDLISAVDDGVNLGEVQDAVEDAELAAGSSVRSKNSQSYKKLVASLRALKNGSLTAFNAFKSMVNGLGNTAELKAAVTLMESVLADGLKPEISLSPASGINFSDVGVNTLSGEQTVLITNSGNYRLSINSVTSSNNYSFIVNTSGGSSPCGTGTFSLVPQESCTVTVKAHPTAAGILNGTLDVTSDSVSVDPASIALTVNGIVSGSAVLTADKSLLEFDAVAVGVYAEQSIVFTNSGAAAATGISTAFSGSGAAVYTATNNCTTVPAGQSCTVTVRFTSASPAGMKDAVLTVSSNAADVSVQLRAYSVSGGMTSEILFKDTSITSLSERNLAMCNDGKAHAVLTSRDKITYGFFDGDEWYLSDVGVTVNEFDIAAITADSECMPHIAYTKTENSDSKLYYAHSRNGFWQSYDVDSEPVSAMNQAVSIVSDGTDIYISSIVENGYKVVVDKTTNFGAAFTRTEIGSALPGPESTLLKKDSSGVIHMVFRDSDGIHYANSQNDPWTVDEEIAYGFMPSIAFDGSTVHVIYHDGGLYETLNSGSGWSSVPVSIDTQFVGAPVALTVPGGIDVYYKYDDASEVMKRTYSSGTWSSPVVIYNNHIDMFYNSMKLAGTNAPNGNSMVLYDANSTLTSDSHVGGVWGNPVALWLTIGINPELVFDMEFDPQGVELYGVLGDLIDERSGGLYRFTLEDGGIGLAMLDTPEKYTVSGVDMVKTASGEHICYIYSLEGNQKLGYLNNDTNLAHSYLADASSYTCSVAENGSGEVYIVYGNSFNETSVYKTGVGVADSMDAELSASSVSMQYIPSAGKLFFSYYSYSDAYGLSYLNSTTDLSIQAASHDRGFAELAVSAADTPVVLFGGTDGTANTSFVKISECETDLSSCNTQTIYTPSVNSYIEGMSLAVDADDNVYAGVIDNGRGIVLLKGVLGSSYTDTVIDSSSDISSASFDAIKVLLNPVTNDMSIFYRSGSRLIHTTEALIPVLGVSHVYKNFGSVTMGSSSAELTVSVTNNGTQRMFVRDIKLDHGDNFVLTTAYGSGSCPSDLFSLYPQESCSVKVKFRPFASGAMADRLIVETNRSREEMSLFGVGQ